MSRPKLEPHLSRLLTEEATIIMSLFQVSGREGFHCSLSAPSFRIGDTLQDGQVYAVGWGDTAEDAVYEARDKMWKGL